MTSRTRLFTTPVLLAGLALAGTLGTVACGGGHTEDSTAGHAATAAPVAVRTVALGTSNQADRFEAAGVVQARTTAGVSARILATVREVRVKAGDRVQAGQTLVVLDGRDLSAQARAAQAAAQAAGQGLTAAEAEQKAAEAALVLARASQGRMATLEAKRSATKQELDEATAGLRAAEARVAGATARVAQASSAREGATAAGEAANTAASFAVLTAPFTGVITATMTEAGNTAVPGVPLVRLEDTTEFRLEVRVDEARVAQVATGTTVSVTLDGELAGTALEGTVTEVAAVDAGARAFFAKVRLPRTPGLRSGLFGRASLAGTTRAALVVPAEAVVRHGQVTSVFVVEQGTARMRLVHLRGTEVVAGLAAGDQVVVSPPSSLSDGQKVSEARK